MAHFKDVLLAGLEAGAYVEYIDTDCVIFAEPDRMAVYMAAYKGGNTNENEKKNY